ncbi:MAG: ATP-binding protein [Promethearchaeota archaeon]
MTQSVPAFNFRYIPLNVDKTSVKVFQNAKNAFSLEYAVFDPKSVWINMVPIEYGHLRKKGGEKGIATIQQFAAALGLHPDFHKIGESPIHVLLELLQTEFQVSSDGSKYYCGGILGLKDKTDRYFTTSESFIDTILEISTDSPQFAFIQLVFKSVELPKESQTQNEQDNRMVHVRFDIQQGKVERRFHPQKINIMEETGCFEFSPRILVVEKSQESLRSKLDRLSVLFMSNGFKVRFYPTFWRRFSSFRRLCSKRKLISPIILDGYSLMNFITPPQRQFSHEGYSLVSNKTDYTLSTGISETSPQRAINLGIPIVSGKTSDIPLLIDGKDLSRHMVVFGMTGEGKSRFIYGLIKEFHQKNVRFLIFDPKGEYLAPVQSFCNTFIYLKPGSTEFPWGINIFQIPKNEAGESIIPLNDHIQFVVSILEHIFEDMDAVSPQMRRLLHLAVIQTVKDQGDFQTLLKWLKIPDKLGMKGAYLENTTAGIMNCIEKLLFGNTGRCFTVHKTTYEISDLLEHNAIIDLSAFESMEDQSGRQIFLNVVLQYIYYFVRSFRSPFKEETLPKNIFILDEIQKLIPAKSPRARTSETMIAKGPWTLRAYDISMIFIGTDPIVKQPILTNAGVVTVFFTKFDPYVISNLLGLTKNEYEQFRNLLKAKPDERRCIISINGQISLLKTNNFSVELQSLMNQDKLQNLPLQKRLHDSYQNLVFDPIK